MVKNLFTRFGSFLASGGRLIFVGVRKVVLFFFRLLKKILQIVYSVCFQWPAAFIKSLFNIPFVFLLGKTIQERVPELEQQRRKREQVKNDRIRNLKYAKFWQFPFFALFYLVIVSVFLPVSIISRLFFRFLYAMEYLVEDSKQRKRQKILDKLAAKKLEIEGEKAKAIIAESKVKEVETTIEMHNLTSLLDED